MNALVESDDTRSLLQELIQITGESEAIAVQEAIRERLDRLHQQSPALLSDRLLSIGKAAATHFHETTVNNLYDENGLPQ
jgi:hypothetical protein